MPQGAPTEAAPRHLTLAPPLSTRAAPLALARAAMKLQGSPFRPGELPVVVALRLGAAARPRCEDAARGAGVPVALWLRAAIDAGRLLAALQCAGWAPTDAVALLDSCAELTLPVLCAAPELGRYAQALRRGEPASVTRVSPDGVVEVMVPEELRVAWLREATDAALSLEDWSLRMVSVAPSEPLAWEAAAASAGARVLEWGYACALRRRASASACPQPRT